MGTTDANAIEEVLVQHAYQNLNAPVRVNIGENWLDLGANTGTSTPPQT
jgi:hypothetical protein